MFSGLTERTVGQTKNLSYGVKSVVSGETYTYRVLAGDESSYGPASASASATYSAVPKNVKVTAENKHATLTWNKVTNASGYRVQMLKNNAWTTIALSTANTYTVKNLTNGTTYSFKVLANVDGKWSAASIVVAAKPDLIPANFRAVVAGKSITLRWTALSGATRYRIQRLSDSTWSTIGYAGGTSFVDKNVESGKSYSYRILCFDGTAWHTPSAAITGSLK